MRLSTRAPSGAAALLALVTSGLLCAGCPAEEGGAQLTPFPQKDIGSQTDIVEDVAEEPDVPPDPDAAVVAFVAPLAGACISTTLEVKAEATHEAGIEKVELFVDGAVVSSADEGDEDVYTLTLDLLGREDGPLSLSLVATPVAGPKGKAKLDIVVDNTAPVLELERPVGNEVVMGELRVRGVATDDGCGIASISTTLTGGNEDLADELVIAEPLAEQPFDMRLDASDVGSFDGQSDVRVLDAAGNEVTAARQVYVVRPLRFLQAMSHRPEDVAKFAQIVGGDWDGDGLLDVFMPTNKGVFVTHAKGDGTFGDPVALTTDSTIAVEPVDLDADGDLDLIAGSSTKPAKLAIIVRAEGDVLVKEHTLEVPDTLAINDIVLADLTGDEIMDAIVTTNSDKKSVLVYVGLDESHYADKPEGERRFFSDQPKSFGGVANVRDAKAGDFDNDGNMDLALGSKGDSKISVFLGDGAGGFLAANDTVVDEDAIALAAGYFSGGAFLDLVVTSEKSGKLYLLGGQGNGYFAVTELPIVGGKPTSIVTGHFDEDEKLDFAVAYTGAKSVSVFQGGFIQDISASYIAGNTPASAIAGQFTDDSFEDIVVMNGVDQQFTILVGNGDGTFQGAPQLLMPLECDAGDNCSVGKPTAMAVGDFDTVAGLDVAFVTTMKQGYFPLYFYASDGTWPTNPLGAALLPSKFHVNIEEEYAGVQKGALVDLVAGDFNGDGLADLAIANQAKYVENPHGETNPVSIDVLMKKAVPGFEFEVLDGFWAGLDVGTVLDDQGNEKLDPVALKRAGAAKIVDIEAGDMNNDGMADLLVLTAFGAKAQDEDGKPNTAARVSIFEAVGKGAFLGVARSAVDADAQSDPGPVRMMVGDVDVDGNNDVVVLNNKISDVAVLYNTDVLADGQLVAVVSTNPVAAALHQMNEDSDSFPDVLSVGKDMRVSFGRAHAIGEQPFETPLSYSNYPGKKPTSIDAADFNGDGLEDVVIADGSTSVVYLYANIGDRQFAKEPVIIHTALNPKAMAAKDMDGDTCVDLVLLGDGGVTVLRNQLCD